MALRTCVLLGVAGTLALTLVTACGGGSPSSGSVAGGPVVHALVPRTDDTTGAFKPAPTDPASSSSSGLPADVPSGTSSGGALTAQAFPGVPSVGALFFDGGAVATLHYCTASVVHSAGGDLIVTAAHCVYGSMFGGYQNHILFVPGYHDGIAPYGTWFATSAVVDKRWVASSDPDVDVAFLTVREVGASSAASAGIGGSTSSTSSAGDGPTLESLTGADRFHSDPSYTDTVDVIAYPFGAEQPVSCANHTTQRSATQLRFDCGGFPDGSSGAPFLTADGALAGVVGGYQQGGDTPETSYSSYFGADIDALYGAAAHV
jgi:V8-like Glu-specific endopeptidase